MAHINQVVLSGNATRDGELKQVGQSSLLVFGIAVNRWWQDNGEWKSEATFMDCELWGQAAGRAAERVRKGVHLTVQGALKQSTWNDKTTGAKRSKIVLTVRQVDAPKPPDGTGPTQGEPPQQAASQQSPQPASQAPGYVGPDDRIPF